MAYFIGGLLGGLVAVFLLSIFLEWAFFKRISDSALVGIPASVVAAVVISVIFYGFGNANGGQWSPFPGGISYIVAGFIVGPLRLRGYLKRRDSQETHSDLRDTFE